MPHRPYKNKLLASGLLAVIMLILSPADSWAHPPRLFTQRIVNEDGEALITEDEKLWKSSLGVSYVTVSGNSTSNTLSLNGDATRKTERDEFVLKGGGIYGKSEGVTSARNWNLSAGYNHNINAKPYVYVLTGFAGNQFAGYHYRYNLQPGIGYHILEDHIEINGELGPGYIFENRIEDSDNSFFSGRAFLNFKWFITDKTEFYQDMEYIHNFQNSDDYRVNANTSLTIKINDIISFRTGISVQYLHLPVPGNKHTDVFTSTSLVFVF